MEKEKAERYVNDFLRQHIKFCENVAYAVAGDEIIAALKGRLKPEYDTNAQQPTLASSRPPRLETE